MRTEKGAFSVSWASWNRQKCPEIVLKFSKNWVLKFHFLLLGALGAGPSSFGKQRRLSEITIESIKHLRIMGKIWGPVPPGRSLKLPLWLIGGSCICSFDWHQGRWPCMFMNCYITLYNFCCITSIFLISILLGILHCAAIFGEVKFIYKFKFSRNFALL